MESTAASNLTEIGNNRVILPRALDAGRVYSQPHLVAKPSPFRRNGYLETGKRFAQRSRCREIGLGPKGPFLLAKFLHEILGRFRLASVIRFGFWFFATSATRCLNLIDPNVANGVLSAG